MKHSSHYTDYYEPISGFERGSGLSFAAQGINHAQLLVSLDRLLPVKIVQT